MLKFFLAEMSRSERDSNPNPFYWITNYIHYRVGDEVTYPFQNFNGAAIEIWNG